MPLRAHTRLFCGLLTAVCILCGAYIAPRGVAAAALAKPTVDATCAILINAQNGDVVFEKDADALRSPASTTKILTALLAIESGIPMNTVITVGTEVASIPSDSSVMPVLPGENVTFEALLHGLIINSGNDAANAIAVAVSGSVSEFVALMNTRAAQIGCTNTTFKNAHGYTADGHLTTARDLALIMQEALLNEGFRNLIAAQSYVVPVSNKRTKPLTLQTRNSLMLNTSGNAYYYPDAIGGKTGYTMAAGQSYVAAANRNGLELITVVLNSTVNGKWTDSIAMMDYGFSLYTVVDPLALYAQAPQSRFVTLPDDPDLVIGRVELALTRLENTTYAPIVLDAESAQSAGQSAEGFFQYEWVQANTTGPVAQGDTLGYAIFSYPGYDSQRYALTAAADVALTASAGQPTQSLAATNTAAPSQTLPAQTVQPTDIAPVETAANAPAATWAEYFTAQTALIALAVVGLLSVVLWVNFAYARRGRGRSTRRRYVDVYASDAHPVGRRSRSV